MKTLTLSTGENVYIYDDVFEAHECDHYNHFAQNSLFRCGFNSSTIHENMTFASLSSPYSDEDVDRFGMFNSKNFRKVDSHFNGLKRQASWLTLIRMMPEVYFHCDATEPHAMTMIYYVNMEWNKNYGGETIICNSMGEPELAIAAKPNRLAIYNSNLMHKPSGLSPKSPPNRFTFVSIFK